MAPEPQSRTQTGTHANQTSGASLIVTTLFASRPGLIRSPTGEARVPVDSGQAGSPLGQTGSTSR